MSTNEQRHHLFFEAQVWRSREDTRRIRNMGSAIVKLAVEPHKELHKNVTSVPVPDRFMAGRVLRTYEPVRHIFNNMDRLCYAFDQASMHPRATRLEYELGQLIICSIEAQRPYIADGLIYEKD